jgi:hypothetical protein
MRFLGYAIIIGAMKSGTTTLHFNLAQHPEIVTGTEKELDFFKRRKKPDVASYEALFPHLDKSRHAYTLDSSPNYTKTRKWSFAPRRIAALPGRKRLIYLLRDPIERIDSHIAHNVAEDRWSADDWSMNHVLDISAYARQLARFEKVGLVDDVLLLDFAELRVDPVGVSYRVHDFLGIRRVQPESVAVQNTRKVDVQFLRQDQISELKALLRDDVEILIGRYGFEAAKSWDIV